MTGRILQALYDEKAFKPAPSLWELALSHVDLGELGVEAAPEARVRSGLCANEGITLLTGASGSGKSSVLAYVASQLTEERTAEKGRTYLPIFVPVVTFPDRMDIEQFGRAAIDEVLRSIHGTLPAEYQKKLERGKAHEIMRQSGGTIFNGKVAAKLFGIGPEVGMQVGSEVVSLTEAPSLDSWGGVKTLGDLLRAAQYELLLLVEDTDAWAQDENSGRARGRAFFGRVARALASEVDVAVAIAVQTHWVDADPLEEVHALRERAQAVVEMPHLADPERARPLVEAMLQRRIEVALDGDASRTPVAELFSEDAVEQLTQSAATSGSLRVPLMRIRDALDRYSDALPDRLELDHLLHSY